MCVLIILFFVPLSIPNNIRRYISTYAFIYIVVMSSYSKCVNGFSASKTCSINVQHKMTSSKSVLDTFTIISKSSNSPTHFSLFFSLSFSLSFIAWRIHIFVVDVRACVCVCAVLCRACPELNQFGAWWLSSTPPPLTIMYWNNG